MLYHPREILNGKTYRQYALDVYNLLLTRQKNQTQTSQQQRSLFSSSFRDIGDANRCQDYVLARVKTSLASQDCQEVKSGACQEEAFFLLPPLFFRSSTSAILRLPSGLIVLFLCESGPIIPVVYVQPKNDLHTFDSLPADIIRLYNGTSTDYLTRDNAHILLK
jgi:hypothetical protein